MTLRWFRLKFLHTGALAVCAAASLGLAAAASADGTPVLVPDGFHAKTFVTSGGTMSKPDDIVRLGDHLFVGWQNGVGSQGEPSPAGTTTSTVVEYDRKGNAIRQWTPTGRVDGMAADPAKNLVYATVNEDGNSSFYVIDPAGSATRLIYNDPQGVMTGGSDAISIGSHGNVYISMSNPSSPGASAVALATINSPPGKVTLSPTFADNMSGVNDGNHPRSTTTLALTDPDSNTIVPPSSSRFANMFMLDSQGDGQLVFAPSGFDSSTPASQLTQLTLSAPGQSTHPVVDDVRWAPAGVGELYVVDQGAGVVYQITGPFEAGQALASQPTDPSNPPLQGDVVKVNLRDGTESAFATGLNSPKGLLFVTRSRRNDQQGEPGQRGSMVLTAGRDRVRRHEGGPRRGGPSCCLPLLRP